ncbi:DinB family protein [Bacillus sp. KH172YL63]|uniref:DinB family protein n=1 Tax=Bacillus sp. KH172YL63 TaxID=2709784 RepID=UPI0013E413A2|nr:DinB family protein [Bacillus sp. KH172YL63]BCB03979.1 hypothetical protein KH172YL63_21120 [Bacillus sp. KH172YL63]
MNFEKNEAVQLLGRTPVTLHALLSGLGDGWLIANEGEGTWTPSQVIDHLIECEKTNWIPRIVSIIDSRGNRDFPPFDRDAHLTYPSSTIDQKLSEFTQLRMQNVERLNTLISCPEDLERTGIHPAFGEVKLSELLSTWVVHDLTHLSQIVRVMAERYREDVGPWEAYLGALKVGRNDV